MEIIVTSITPAEYGAGVNVGVIADGVEAELYLVPQADPLAVSRRGALPLATYGDLDMWCSNSDVLPDDRDERPDAICEILEAACSHTAAASERYRIEAYDVGDDAWQADWVGPRTWTSVPGLRGMGLIEALAAVRDVEGRGADRPLDYDEVRVVEETWTMRATKRGVSPSTLHYHTHADAMAEARVRACDGWEATVSGSGDRDSECTLLPGGEVYEGP